MYKYGMEAVSFTACHLGKLYSVATTSCKNDETLPRKNDVSCFKSLLVTGL